MTPHAHAREYKCFICVLSRACDHLTAIPTTLSIFVDLTIILYFQNKMVHTVDSDGHIGRYLAAQPELNTSLEYNADSGVLYDASLANKSHAQIAVVAGPGLSRAMAAKYAQFVGPGMLSGLMVAPGTVEHDKHAVPKTSLTSQLIKLADALRLGNKETEMAWIGPAKVNVDRTGDASRHHGMATVLEIDDGVAGSDQGAEVSVILPMKIAGAVAAMGYDAQIVHKVGRLVRDNMMTANAPMSDKSFAFAEIATSVEAMLDDIFKPADHVRKVHFNSNEPVLLINDFGRCGGVKLGSVVTEVLEQLHEKHNVWPVRVYAGTFIEGDDSEGPEFSATLVNVTNTEIGGPSMIQLLDQPCNTLGWNGCMRREVWNGRELLERFEKPEQPPHQATVAPGQAASTAVNDVAEIGEAGPEHVPVSLEDDDEVEDVDHNRLDEDPEVVDEEQPQQYSYDDPHRDRAPVKYPTWEHSTQHGSLIDLVRSQNTGKPPEAGVDDDSVEQADTDAATTEKIRTGSTSSEGFVVL